VKFTVVFDTQEAYDLSYGLVFIPCPVWIRGQQEVINLNPEDPAYRPGSVQRLLEQENIESFLLEGRRECLLVVHDTGYGSQQDLETLRTDLEDVGYSVAVHRLGSPAR
jgi:hypothetical protein